MKKMNVESFNLDHTKVAAPYIRLAGTSEGEHGDVIYKYDIRFCQPNKEHMDMPALHSIEHLMAENIRNHHDRVVDLSPMGCQTGFYLSVLNDDDKNGIENVMEKTLNDVLEAKEVPACNEVQCGWAASHSLEGAKEIAQKMLADRNEWGTVFAE
ncbi:S-ribosylhomocysteine lyase [Jeotgalicoccus huakuii]|mgnify:FL=1|uniref:S-ribosylhomocysteine lyase n=1 Tax=Jeotgalicoccus TaxID=227979 RepID=UPI0004031F2E|nr:MULTISPECIES: S-ribosylhomocysteine lyase [Jeotgalicoccus]MCK1976180.1 S-ribosylhomocysteine lyase [Jeotgalicoccus huakuii]QQD84942.1 S-ribosylhomocysteine lyase [Jeotgalicoccus sp. ATCC 8456]